MDRDRSQMTVSKRVTLRMFVEMSKFLFVIRCFFLEFKELKLALRSLLCVLRGGILTSCIVNTIMAGVCLLVQKTYKSPL